MVKSYSSSWEIYLRAIYGASSANRHMNAPRHNPIGRQTGWCSGRIEGWVDLSVGYMPKRFRYLFADRQPSKYLSTSWYWDPTGSQTQDLSIACEAVTKPLIPKITFLQFYLLA